MGNETTLCEYLCNSESKAQIPEILLHATEKHTKIALNRLTKSRQCILECVQTLKTENIFYTGSNCIL